MELIAKLIERLEKLNKERKREIERNLFTILTKYTKK